LFQDEEGLDGGRRSDERRLRNKEIVHKLNKKTSNSSSCFNLKEQIVAQFAFKCV